MQNNQLHLLKTRRFLPLFITQFLGAFNDNAFKTALTIFITYHLAQGIGLNYQILVVLLPALFILPFFLFSATAGQLADKYEKSRLITIIKSIEIILMIIAAVGFYLQNVTTLMLVLFALGCHAAFFGPLKYAILPDQLHDDELVAGNGLIEAGTFLSILLGTLVGGYFILHTEGLYIICSLLFLLACGGWWSSLFILKTTSDNPHLKISFNILRETTKLMEYSKQYRDLFLCILGISWFWLVGSIFIAEFPLLVKDVLHANQDVVTFFIALFSIGLAIGSLLCNRLLKGKVVATYAPVGALGITLFTLDLYFATYTLVPISGTFMTFSQFLSSFSGWRISFDLVLIAMCGGLYSVPLYAILQHRSEKTHRARVIASNNVVNAFFMAGGAIATMMMLKIGFTINHIFLSIAVANLFVVFYICRLLPDVVLRSFFRWLFISFYRVKIIGIENYHQAGERVVIIANHTSFIDAILLATFLPDKLTFAINSQTAKKWWIRIFLNLVAAFPLDPMNPMALKSLINLLQEDKDNRCVIFPEGRITVTGALMKIYEGPALVADKSHATLMPIRIQGAQFTPFSRLRGKVRIRWMPNITITIFPAETIQISTELKGRKRRQKVGQQLYDVMTRVMFESSDYHRTLFSSLLDAKSLHGSHLEIIEDIERKPTTYQQFITRCFILGSLIANKTEPGEHVGILLPNTISTAITFFALQAYCRIPAMLNFSTGAHHVALACQTANIKLVYTSSKFIEVGKLHDIITTLTAIGVNVIYLENLRDEVGMVSKLKGFIYAQFPRLAYKLINHSQTSRSFLDPETTAVVIFTSGSEGTPKGVLLSHQNLQANRLQLSACVDFSSLDKIFNALPVFHSFGLTGGMLLPLLSGVKIFFYPSPLHYRIIPELSYDTNATILFGTDTFLAGYAKYAHPYDFYSIRYVFAGAEKLREETRAIWSQKFGVRIFEGYGTSETSPVLATNTPMQNKAGTVGRFLPDIKYQLKPVPGIEKGGLLVVSGPNIMKGYLLSDQPGIVIPPPDGWYETGDIVEVDEAGFVTIKGRLKRFAKIAGEMVSLTMIEQYIYTLWPDYEHAVISVPDEKKGEKIILVTTYSLAGREQLVSYAKSINMGELAIPKKIIILKTMPLLGTGKVDYSTLKDQVADAPLSMPM